MRITTCQLKWASLAALLICSRGLQAQTIVVGPGVIQAPFVVGNTHILSGTEIIATHFEQVEEVYIRGGAAAITNWATDLVVDGGLFKGASVTTLANTQEAYAGSAFAFGPGFNYAKFYAGTYVGGSVLVDAATPGSGDFRGGPAILAGGGDALFDISIYGGRYEGGVVSLAASPAMVVSRAPALHFQMEYGGNLDIYGGEFIGGIVVKDSRPITIHGSDFSIQPPPVNGRVPTADFVVSGKYADGTPFANSITWFANVPFYQSGDRIRFGAPLPEPATLPLLAVGGLFSGALRRSKRPLTPPSPPAGMRG